MTEATTTEPKVIPVPLDEFGEMAKQKLASNITEYNGLARLVKAAEGDPVSLLEELRNTSDNEDVAKIRAAIEELDNKREQLFKARDEILKPMVTAFAENAKAELGDKPEKLAKLGKTIKTARAYLADTYCPEVLEDLPALEGGRKGGGGSGAGTGNRRIRGFDFYVDGTLATTRDSQGNESSNAAAAAKAIEVTTEDIRQAFWAAAGTDDSSKYPSVVEFKVTVSAKEEGGEAKVYAVVAKRTATEETATA